MERQLCSVHLSQIAEDAVDLGLIKLKDINYGSDLYKKYAFDEQEKILKLNLLLADTISANASVISASKILYDIATKNPNMAKRLYNPYNKKDINIIRPIFIVNPDDRMIDVVKRMIDTGTHSGELTADQLLEHAEFIDNACFVRGPFRPEKSFRSDYYNLIIEVANKINNGDFVNSHEKSEVGRLNEFCKHIENYMTDETCTLTNIMKYTKSEPMENREIIYKLGYSLYHYALNKNTQLALSSMDEMIPYVDFANRSKTQRDETSNSKGDYYKFVKDEYAEHYLPLSDLLQLDLDTILEIRTLPNFYKLRQEIGNILAGKSLNPTKIVTITKECKDDLYNAGIINRPDYVKVQKYQKDTKTSATEKKEYIISTLLASGINIISIVVIRQYNVPNIEYLSVIAPAITFFSIIKSISNKNIGNNALRK